MKKIIISLLCFVMVLTVSVAVAEGWICPACNGYADGNFCNNCGSAKPHGEDYRVRLGDMEIFLRKTDGGSSYQYSDEYDRYLTDNYGNTYSHSVSVGTGSLTYLVNHKYLTFSGTVAFPKGLYCDDYRSSATLSVYGDDRLIAEFKNINEATRPEAFSLNIGQYERITLKWTCKGRNIWEDWGYFATIFDGTLVRAD